MKTADYFPVKTNNYTSQKSLNIRLEYGWAGYGIYFAILQKLASVEKRTLSIEPKNLKAIAFDLHCTIDELQPIINEFFTIDNDEFYSDELNNSLAISVVKQVKKHRQNIHQNNELKMLKI